MKEPLKLWKDVRTLDGRLLLGAGTVLDGDVLGELAASAPPGRWPEVPVLGYGTVREDIAAQMDFSVYETIFGQKERKHLVFRLMEAVRFPLPILEGLDWFREKDFYTYRHILMVFALSCYVAHRLLKESSDVQMEAAAGPFHDLGKICTPLPVLRKCDPLQRSERRMLEEHTVAGYVLLTFYLGDHNSFAAMVARDHHERRDGSGYLRGIRQVDRLVEIVSACDVYDALVTPRPYRRGNYDNRTALEVVTGMADRGTVNWDVVRHLVSLNRAGCPDPEECVVSLDKRGVAPLPNNYGVIVEDPD